jgi:uncharacterized membrane protein
MAPADSASAETILLAPNCSLSDRGALLFFGGICCISLGIAGWFTLRGLWPVLPFAGAELLLLGWALRGSLRRRACMQIIAVSDEQVIIETRDHAGVKRIEFPRHWAQVKLRRAETALHPSCLTIESHGRSYELGSFLTEEERRGLAGRLRRSVGRINESPRLSQQDQD